MNTLVVDINNYPILGELSDIQNPLDWSEKHSEVCYVGAMSEIRGGREIVNSLEQLNEED